MCAWLLFPSCKACSTSLPSGNQVDSLPLVAHRANTVLPENHIDEDGICPELHPQLCIYLLTFGRSQLVLALHRCARAKI